MEQHIFSVNELNCIIKDMFDGIPIFQNIFIKGEVSNLKKHASGHQYMVLKDADATLRCVLFKFDALRLKEPIANGDKIVVGGRISVYPRDGQYQLYAQTIEKEGSGDLHAAFEKLKTKLAEEGLFSDSHKKPLPKKPKSIAIVTSKSGAVLSDMCKILKARYPIAAIYFVPAAVQGESAPEELADAISLVNRHGKADLLIVGRGGGSLEDLSAFNTETVARAIFHSKIPVISAVGHEPDVTIADFVADVRASTPSNAAEIAVPDKNIYKSYLEKYDALFFNVLQKNIQHKKERLKTLLTTRAFRTPETLLHQPTQQLDYLQERLHSGMEKTITAKSRRFETLQTKLETLNPLAVLTRGYAIVEKNGKPVTSAKQQQGDNLNIRMHDGALLVTVDEIH